MLKVGDRIVNKPRTDDKLPNGYGKGVIMKISNAHYFIEWQLSRYSNVLHSWAIKEVIELDIQEVRSNKLDEILK